MIDKHKGYRTFVDASSSLMLFLETRSEISWAILEACHLKAMHHSRLEAEIGARTHSKPCIKSANN